jgi:hydroxypyruvate isomerase
MMRDSHLPPSSRLPVDRRAFLLAGGAAAAATPALGFTTPHQDAAPEAPTLPGQTPHTTFAINIEMWFRSLPFTDRIRAVAALGFKWVEFWGWQGRDLEAIKSVCEETGVKVAQFIGWGFEPGMNNPVNHDQLEQTIRASCRAANDLGATMLTVVGGNDQPGMTQPEMHRNIVDGLKRVAPIAQAAKVMLILEPMNIRVDHKGHCLYGSQPTLDICREVDSPWVKINWDIYHLQITEGDLCRRIREGYDQIGYVQIADNPGRREPGTGEINYTRVFQELAELGYDKPVGVECWPEGKEARAAERLRQADTWK